MLALVRALKTLNINSRSRPWLVACAYVVIVVVAGGGCAEKKEAVTQDCARPTPVGWQRLLTQDGWVLSAPPGWVLLPKAVPHGAQKSLLLLEPGVPVNPTPDAPSPQQLSGITVTLRPGVQVEQFYSSALNSGAAHFENVLGDNVMVILTEGISRGKVYAKQHGNTAVEFDTSNMTSELEPIVPQILSTLGRSCQ